MLIDRLPGDPQIRGDSVTTRGDLSCRWASRIVLAVLPIVLATLGYYRAQLLGSALPRPQGDAAFYAYQLRRVAECHGAWWKIADDQRLGAPYPSEFAKHPGLFEGVELMLLASLVAVHLSAAWTYHIAAIATLAANGWVAAWVVKKYTRSTLWAAVAVGMITLNESVAARIPVHLHLFKFGWIVLAVWLFSEFMRTLDWRRGALLGLAAALVLQSSFYLGYFTALGLAGWYLIELAAGRVRRAALAGTLVAAAVFVATAAVLCFPVVANYSPIAGSDQYFQRNWAETWVYGSEIWKYFVPKHSWLRANYFRDLRHKIPAPPLDEGWNFPGFAIVLAVSVVLFARLRGSPLCKRLDGFVWIALGLMAVWSLLSLSGGPSALLFHAAPSFRCYGRAGLLVVAIGSVVAPIVFNELVRGCRRPRVGVLLTIGLVGLAASDAYRAAMTFPGWPAASAKPEWVDWLREQPNNRRLAVFMTHPPIPATLDETTAENEPFYWWGVSSLEWLPEHRHRTLAGATFSLVEGDLRLLGGSYDRINPAGLRFIASLGYTDFAIDGGYLAKSPWIADLPWLDRVECRGDWVIYRSNDLLTRLPKTPFDALLSRRSDQEATRTAPLGCWITGSWPIDEDTIVDEGDWAFLVWRDSQGRDRSPLQLALYQHVFGPSIPAFTIRTPAEPGSYRLVVLDRDRRNRASFDYRIVAGLAVSQPRFPAKRPSATVHTTVVAAPAAADPRAISGWDVTLTNASSTYIQAQVARQHLSANAQAHPGLRSAWLRAGDGGMVLKLVGSSPAANLPVAEWEVPVPEDLPPGGRLTIRLPADRVPGQWSGQTFEIVPSFKGVGHALASKESADIMISARTVSSVSKAARGDSEARRR